MAARSAALHRAAYLMVGEQSLAQDLVQEALTKTYVAWPRLRDKGNAEAYTRKAITHTAISWFRRKGWSAERSTDQLGSLSPDARYFSSDCKPAAGLRRGQWQAGLLRPGGARVRHRLRVAGRPHDRDAGSQAADHGREGRAADLHGAGGHVQVGSSAFASMVGRLAASIAIVRSSSHS